MDLNIGGNGGPLLVILSALAYGVMIWLRHRMQRRHPPAAKPPLPVGGGGVPAQIVVIIFPGSLPVQAAPLLPDDEPEPGLLARLASWLRSLVSPLV